MKAASFPLPIKNKIHSMFDLKLIFPLIFLQLVWVRVRLVWSSAWNRRTRWLLRARRRLCTVCWSRRPPTHHRSSLGVGPMAACSTSSAIRCGGSWATAPSTSTACQLAWWHCSAHTSAWSTWTRSAPSSAEGRPSPSHVSFLQNDKIWVVNLKKKNISYWWKLNYIYLY